MAYCWRFAPADNRLDFYPIAAPLSAFRSEFILALAGFALLSTIGNSLYTAAADAAEREAAVITFVVIASELCLYGIGAVFWGLVA